MKSEMFKFHAKIVLVYVIRIVRGITNVDLIFLRKNPTVFRHFKFIDYYIEM